MLQQQQYQKELSTIFSVSLQILIIIISFFLEASLASLAKSEQLTLILFHLILETIAWEECSGKEALPHWRCERNKLVELLWKSGGRLLGKKTKREIPFDPTIPLLAVFPKQLSHHLQQPMNIHVYNHTMDKANVLCMHHGVILSHKEVICRKMDGF